MFAFKFASLLASIAFVNGANITPFISSGSEAEITEFPFLVSIQHIDVHVCSGSLLSEKWILSAARCFLRPIDELIIEYGRTEIAPGAVGTYKSTLSRTILHENFAQNPLANNIAVAESQASLTTGFNEPFVKLPVSGARFLSGQPSVHAGWGHIGANVRNNLLHKADLKILSHAECVDAVGDTPQPNREDICAMADSVICNGDIGSPLLVNGIQVGIASFRNGPNCDSLEGKFPNVYTDISYYIDWIEHNTGINYQLGMFLTRNA